MATVIFSFGYMHRRVETGGLVIDVRHFRNPHHNPKFHGLGGDDPRVQADVARTVGFTAKYAEIRNRATSFNGPVYLGCTGGQHRSVALAIQIGKDLGIPVRHLDYTAAGR
jgi:UPF0042 nucleotide-binding protein